MNNIEDIFEMIPLSRVKLIVPILQSETDFNDTEHRLELCIGQNAIFVTKLSQPGQSVGVPMSNVAWWRQQLPAPSKDVLMTYQQMQLPNEPEETSAKAMRLGDQKFDPQTSQAQILNQIETSAKTAAKPTKKGKR